MCVVSWLQLHIGTNRMMGIMGIDTDLPALWQADPAPWLTINQSCADLFVLSVDVE